MSDNKITVDMDFVRGLVGIGVAVARITEVEPELLNLIDIVAPTDDEIDDILEQAMEEFA